MFLTTLYSTPALRNSARSFVTCSTVIPLKSRKTAAVIRSKRPRISPIWSVLFSFVPRFLLRLSGAPLSTTELGGAALAMAYASSVLPMNCAGSIFTPGPMVDETVMLRR